MKKFVRCGQLFTGREDEAEAEQTLVFDEEGVIDYVGLEAPRRAVIAPLAPVSAPP